MHYADHPAPHELSYRLITPTGLKVGLHFPPGAESDALAEKARAVVTEAFDLGGYQPPRSDQDLTEIISQTTLDHIDRLERLLQQCRNAMIDALADAVPDEELWLELIDEAEKALK